MPSSKDDEISDCLKQKQRDLVDLESNLLKPKVKDLMGRVVEERRDYERPENAELVLGNDGAPAEELADRIVGLLEWRGVL